MVSALLALILLIPVGMALAENSRVYNLDIFMKANESANHSADYSSLYVYGDTSLNVSMGHEDTCKVIANITNTGNTTIKGSVWVDISPPDATDLYSRTGEPFPLKENMTHTFQIEFSPQSLSTEDFKEAYNGDFKISVYFLPENRTFNRTIENSNGILMFSINVHVTDRPSPEFPYNTFCMVATSLVIGIVLVFYVRKRRKT